MPPIVIKGVYTGMRYYEFNQKERITLLCKLFIDNYYSDATLEPIALSVNNSDVALLNYTNNTIIVSYLRNYTECEEKITFTYCGTDMLVGYLSNTYKNTEKFYFEYDIKMFHVKQLQEGSLCEK